MILPLVEQTDALTALRACSCLSESWLGAQVTDPLSMCLKAPSTFSSHLLRQYETTSLISPKYTHTSTHTHTHHLEPDARSALLSSSDPTLLETVPACEISGDSHLEVSEPQNSCRALITSPCLHRTARLCTTATSIACQSHSALTMTHSTTHTHTHTQTGEHQGEERRVQINCYVRKIF